MVIALHSLGGISTRLDPGGSYSCLRLRSIHRSVPFPPTGLSNSNALITDQLISLTGEAFASRIFRDKGGPSMKFHFSVFACLLLCLASVPVFAQVNATLTGT